MPWIVLALGAALSWGLYGPALHTGQTKLGSPFRALLCVGLAYMLIGILVPLTALASQGELNAKGWNLAGFTQATMAGGLGAIGAVFIIYAFRAGGLPAYVMPIVFGGAPVINVLFTMYLHPPRETPNPMLWVGFLLVAAGASLVLYFKPQ
jgi:drug/metabolite transporter (DMT)-like permease